MNLDQTFRHMRAIPVIVQLETVEALIATAPDPKAVKLKHRRFYLSLFFLVALFGISISILTVEEPQAKHHILPVSTVALSKAHQAKESSDFSIIQEMISEKSTPVASERKELKKKEVKNELDSEPQRFNSSPLVASIPIDRNTTQAQAESESSSLIKKEFVIYSTDPETLISMITGQARESNVRVSRNALRYKDGEFKKLVLEFAVPFGERENCKWREFLQLNLQGISNLKYGWTQDDELNISDFWYSISEGKVKRIPDVYTASDKVKVKVNR